MNYLPSRYSKSAGIILWRSFVRICLPYRCSRRNVPVSADVCIHEFIKFRVRAFVFVPDLPQNVSDKYATPSVWNIPRKAVDYLTTS